ncbi:MAG TPA: hypothetical protein VEI26_05315 [Terriglobales bacterium]|nr:hypothetical protein [Terriglobales bacterium]
MRVLTFFYALFMAIMALPADAQTGVWLPTQVPANGLGTWWELRADGSAICNWGFFAEARYIFDGTFLTVIPGGDRKDRPRFRVRFDGDRMYSRADQAGAPEAEYRRVGPASPHSPLIGQWASVAAARTGKSAMPGMTGPPTDLPSVRTFTADGLYHVRIIYNTRKGHWDAVSQTIKVDGESEQHFILKETNLIIADAVYRPN